ncbi:hypothetical protein ACA910_016654 [Epithemia clementina (nom. ined.)]
MTGTTEEDPWADVFSKAEGAGPGSLVVSSQEGAEDSDCKATNNRASSAKRSNKRRKRNDTTSLSRSEWKEHLSLRSKYISISYYLLQHPKCSQKFVLKESLLGSPCRGWKLVGNKNQCGCCGQTSFRHVAQFKTENHIDQWPFALYWSLRNVRYSSVISILDNVSIDGTKWRRHRMEMEKARCNFQEGRITTSMLVTLDGKWNDLLNKLEDIERSRTNNVARVSEMVDLIILCDELYYELYYLDLTNHKHGAPEPFFIPHPTVYFGEAYESGEMQDLIDQSLMLKSLDGTAMKWYNIRLSNESKLQINNDDADDDALTVVHRIRFFETLLFFQKAGLQDDASSAQTLWQATAVSAAQEHETPAPPLLRKWRDSARDFMTHLYGYATLPPSHIDEIVAICPKHGTLLELGAGTGYLAHLLQQKGVKVRALDIAPTTSWSSNAITKHKQNSVPINEYHADTPAFTFVERGQIDMLKKALQALGSPNERAACTLLLAYPPPDSEMGYRALKAFVEMGCTTFVYVGEFQGLTGTRQLDIFLENHGTEMKSRLPCPTWGTDAATLSFWKLNATPRPSPKSIISLCDNCNTNSGRRRLRIMRHLHYCSKDCWHEHRRTRVLRDYLVCSGLCGQVSIDELSFGDPKHFHQL